MTFLFFIGEMCAIKNVKAILSTVFCYYVLAMHFIAIPRRIARAFKNANLRC